MSDELVEYEVEVTLEWSGPGATPDDCREALRRSGVESGGLLGEFSVRVGAIYGGDDDDE